jgi:hypothetical protein
MEVGLLPSNSYLLVLTACVDPSAGSSRLERADPEVRLRDYQQSLRFWLRYRDERLARILFIENSGYPLDGLQKIASEENPLGKRVEFVSLNCNSYPAKNSYGYAELVMLDLGLRQSALREETTHMVKATGRLTFPGLGRLLDRIPDGIAFGVDARTWSTPWKRRAVPFVGSQLLIFRHDFYQTHIQRSYEEMARTTHWIESFLYAKLKPLAKEGLMRFPVSADPVGQPAHRYESYSSAKQKTVNWIRAITRVIFPHWWL